MRRRLLFGAATLALLAAVLFSVFCYNTWSYCCGRCTLADFFDPSPLGLLLFGLNLTALLVLLRLRRRPRSQERCCPRCATQADPSWLFCPSCGTSLSHGA